MVHVLAHDREPNQRLRRIVVRLAFVLALFVLLLTVVAWATERESRVECGQHLKYVVTRLQMESPDNWHSISDNTTLGHVLSSSGIAPELLSCPSSGGLYVFQLIQQDRSDLHRVLVAVEPLVNHRRKGANVIFVDGHVEFVAPREYGAIQERRRRITIATWSRKRE